MIKFFINTTCFISLERSRNNSIRTSIGKNRLIRTSISIMFFIRMLLQNTIQTILFLSIILSEILSEKSTYGRKYNISPLRKSFQTPNNRTFDFNFEFNSLRFFKLLASSAFNN